MTFYSQRVKRINGKNTSFTDVQIVYARVPISLMIDLASRGWCAFVLFSLGRKIRWLFAIRLHLLFYYFFSSFYLNPNFLTLSLRDRFGWTAWRLPLVRVSPPVDETRAFIWALASRTLGFVRRRLSIPSPLSFRSLAFFVFPTKTPTIVPPLQLLVVIQNHRLHSREY